MFKSQFTSLNVQLQTLLSSLCRTCIQCLFLSKIKIRELERGLCEIMGLLGMQKVSFNFPPAENLPACRFALKGQCHEVYVLLQPGCILEVKLKEIRYIPYMGVVIVTSKSNGLVNCYLSY